MGKIHGGSELLEFRMLRLKPKPQILPKALKGHYFFGG